MALKLCRTADIPEGGARGFSVPGGRVLGVRQHGRIYLYLNRCPHLGLPLEWEEHEFLDPGGTYIRCANHGALFLRDTGECILGPCRGESLWEIAWREVQGFVVVEEDELPAS